MNESMESRPEQTTPEPEEWRKNHAPGAGLGSGLRSWWDVENWNGVTIASCESESDADQIIRDHRAAHIAAEALRELLRRWEGIEDEVNSGTLRAAGDHSQPRGTGWPAGKFYAMREAVKQARSALASLSREEK